MKKKFLRFDVMVNNVQVRATIKITPALCSIYRVRHSSKVLSPLTLSWPVRPLRNKYASTNYYRLQFAVLSLKSSTRQARFYFNIFSLLRLVMVERPVITEKCFCETHCVTKAPLEMLSRFNSLRSTTSMEYDKNFIENNEEMRGLGVPWQEGVFLRICYCIMCYIFFLLTHLVTFRTDNFSNDNSQLYLSKHASELIN